jgi:hypothetical protein
MYDMVYYTCNAWGELGLSDMRKHSPMGITFEGSAGVALEFTLGSPILSILSFEEMESFPA